MSLYRKKSMGGVTGVVPHTPSKGSLTPLGHADLPWAKSWEPRCWMTLRLLASLFVRMVPNGTRTTFDYESN